MSVPKTSVVIVNWNGARFLPALLRSIGAESVARVVVVDNRSTDDSLEILRQSTSIDVIANDQNAGFGSAANQGIQTCSTPFLLLLNADVEVQQGSITILEQHLKDHPAVAMVAPQLLDPSGKLQRSIRAFPTPFSLALYLSFLDRIFPSGYRPGTKEHLWTHPVDQPMGAALMVRKSVLDEVGTFDPQFFLYMEEVDLCYRIKQKGHPIVYVHDAKMIHHAGGSSSQAWERSQQNFLDSIFRYFAKHFPAKVRTLRLLLPPALLFRSFVLLLMGRFRQSGFFFKEAFRRGLKSAFANAS